MKQFDIITIAFASLIVLTLIFAVWLWKAFYKSIGNDPVLLDNAPARYEDYEAIFYDP